MAQPTLAVFAGGKSQNDASRSKILTQAGAFLAAKGAKIVCVQGDAGLPLLTLSAACTTGADVEVIVADDFEVPSALNDVTITRENDAKVRSRMAADRADIFVALPGSLALATDLYRTAMKQGAPRPTILLNVDNAFEVLRGFVADVLVHNHPKPNNVMQVADSLDDLWARIERTISTN